MQHGGQGADEGVADPGQLVEGQIGGVQLMVTDPVLDHGIDHGRDLARRGTLQAAARRLAAVG